MKHALPLLLALACDTYDPPGLAPAECTALVCERLPSCAPILPGWNTGWDWRTRELCLRSMTCGAERESCVRAVEDLLCVGPGADPEAVDESIYAVWEACGRLGPEEGWGGGIGGRAWRENK